MPHTPVIIDGQEVASVTKVLSVIAKPALYGWYGKYGNKYCLKELKRSGIIGTRFHKAVEQVIHGKKVSTKDKRVLPMVKTFADWYKTAPITVTETEKYVVSQEYRYGGTLDAIGYYGGRAAIFDWKTANRTYPEMPLQLSAYSYAVRDTHGFVDLGVVVRVDKKDPSVLSVHTYELPRLIGVFLSCLKLYNYLHGVKPCEKSDTLQTASKS